MAAGTKTSDETAASAVGATDLVRGVQGGLNVKITLAQIKTFMLGANTFTSTQTIASGTLTANAPALDVTQTWNNAAEVFTALRSNVTNSASNAGSLLADLQVGGVSKFSVRVDGYTVIPGSYSQGGTSSFALICGKVGVNYSTADRLEIANTTLFGWSSGAVGSGLDTVFARLAAASVRQGLAPSATPVAQTLTIGEASRVGTDSNVGGASGTTQPGLGTGTGTLAKYIINGVVIAASGTAAQTYAPAITVNSTLATGLQFNGYGAGALTTDASGNITAASDPRLKFIQRQFSPGLAELSRIKPIVYKWRPDSGMEPENEYAGFDAENVRESIELATWKGKDGLLSLQDRALLAACVNAINELAARPALR